jgi:MYXO-CTERM domain-containing protein
VTEASCAVENAGGGSTGGVGTSTTSSTDGSGTEGPDPSSGGQTGDPDATSGGSTVTNALPPNYGDNREGCACRSTAPPPAVLLLALLLGIGTRRRR